MCKKIVWVWGRNYDSNTKRIMLLQKRAVRIIDKNLFCIHPVSCLLTLARIQCFATFGRTGGGGATPLGVSKRSVVELSGKDQRIALVEYSRLVVLFLVLDQYLIQLWQVKDQTFGNSTIFQCYESISAKLSTVAAWDLHQRVPHSILHRMRCFDAFRLNI